MTAYTLAVTKKAFTISFDKVPLKFVDFETFKKAMFWWRGVWKSKV